jgi:hypothetical protein
MVEHPQTKIYQTTTLQVYFNCQNPFLLIQKMKTME